jgi:hypothetical protein
LRLLLLLPSFCHGQGADESGSKKKKQRKDKDRDKSGGSSSRPQRLKRQRASSPEHGASAGSRGGQQYDELPEEQLAQETAADLDFIDDDGALAASLQAYERLLVVPCCWHAVSVIRTHERYSLAARRFDLLLCATLSAVSNVRSRLHV